MDVWDPVLREGDVLQSREKITIGIPFFFPFFFLFTVLFGEYFTSLVIGHFLLILPILSCCLTRNMDDGFSFKKPQYFKSF